MGRYLVALQPTIPGEIEHGRGDVAQGPHVLIFRLKAVRRPRPSYSHFRTTFAPLLTSASRFSQRDPFGTRIIRRGVGGRQVARLGDTCHVAPRGPDRIGPLGLLRVGLLGDAGDLVGVVVRPVLVEVPRLPVGRMEEGEGTVWSHARQGRMGFSGGTGVLGTIRLRSLPHDVPLLICEITCTLPPHEKQTPMSLILQRYFALLSAWWPSQATRNRHELRSRRPGKAAARNVA